jgi:hypothetical protein
VWSFRTTTFVNVTLPGLLTVPLKLRTPPALAGVGGQFCVTEMSGVVSSGQVAEAEFVTPTELHESAPVATTVVLTEQESTGAAKVAVKGAEAPGARDGRVNTTGLGVTSLSVTTMLTSVLLPVFRTVPA